MAWTPDLVVLTALLAVAAGSDVVRHRIPNAVSVAVAVTGLVSLSMRGGWAAALSGAAALLVVFLALLLAWRRGAIGGGDLKLAAGAAVWVGLRGLPAYLVASGVCAGALAGVSYAASSRAARQQIRANLALAGKRVVVPVPAAAEGRVPVPAGAAFAVGALCALWLGG